MTAAAEEIAADGPVLRRPVLLALKEGLFGSRLNTAITVLTGGFLAWAGYSFLRWAVLDATWSGTAEDCAENSGACWAFLAAKFRFILFAFYPPPLQWRPGLATLLLLVALILSAIPSFWRKELLLAWFLVIVATWLLMSGSATPPSVPMSRWGGLPVTLFVWALCFVAAMPLAILLALGRRSKMGGVRALSVAFIELMRATPMVAILYIAMLILPMAIPGGQLIDKIFRAMIMITLFWSAYLAEVVRGGLQAIPPGQQEAATALGLSYWRMMQLIILPQALRVVVPGIVNQAIGFLLATSLLAVIGIFDLLNTARASAVDPNWLGFYDEAYFFVALIYFTICFGGSRYSLWLERHLRRFERH